MIRFYPIFSGFVVIAMVALGSPAFTAFFSSGNGTAVHKKIPRIPVTRLSNAGEILYPLPGKDWVFLYAGYSTCGTVCPASTGKLKRLSRLTEGQNIAYHFLTITPESDGEAELSRWNNRMDGLFQVYRPGSSKEAANFLRRLGGRTSWLVREDPDHTDFIYLIDPGGSLRMIYADSGITIEQMHEDVTELEARWEEGK